MKVLPGLYLLVLTSGCTAVHKYSCAGRRSYTASLQCVSGGCGCENIQGVPDTVGQV